MVIWHNEHLINVFSIKNVLEKKTNRKRILNLIEKIGDHKGVSYTVVTFSNILLSIMLIQKYKTLIGKKSPVSHF